MKIILYSLLLIVIPIMSFAETFTDDFSNGLRSEYWSVSHNSYTYNVDTSQNNVHFSKSYGGNYLFQAVSAVFQGDLHGDFDVSIDYSNANIARVDGSPGNQVQLNLWFNQTFSVVRSDEINIGQNYHIWADPPKALYGTTSFTNNYGTMRVIRTGTLVKGYHNNDLIWSNNYTINTVTELTFSLQNNGTKDSTSVIFDNFIVTADDITGIEIPEPGSFLLLVISGLAFVFTRYSKK